MLFVGNLSVDQRPFKWPDTFIASCLKEGRRIEQKIKPLYRFTTIFTSVCIFVLWKILGSKPFDTGPYDGLFLVVSTILWISGVGFACLTNSRYTDISHNATIYARAGLIAITAIVSPALFYLARRMNRNEIQKGQHSSVWISHLALILCVISAIAFGISGLGLALTPSLNYNF